MVTLKLGWNTFSAGYLTYQKAKQKVAVYVYIYIYTLAYLHNTIISTGIITYDYVVVLKVVCMSSKKEQKPDFNFY